MAGKSRRVASRQGELSRRRKRAQRGPSGIPAAPARPQQHQNGSGTAAVAVETTAESATATAAIAQQATPAPQAAVSPAERTAPRNAVQTRGQGRPRGERPAAYNYAGAELRRIGILSTVVVAALVAIAVRPVIPHRAGRHASTPRRATA